MKLFISILLIFFGFAQLNVAQDLVETPKPNAMSNVFGVTAEGGVTLGITDYTKDKINYTIKGSLEYYFPSTGAGNIGLRAFAQRAFVSGQNAPPSSGNPTDEFLTKVDMAGAGLNYILSFGDAIYPWVGFGVSFMWVHPEDANGNQLPNYEAENHKNHWLSYNGDIGLRIMVAKNMSLNLSGGIIVASKDFIDDIETGPNNDMMYTATAGLSYYFGRDRDSDGDGVPNSDDACPETPLGVKVDEYGCPLDTDKDGVADNLDKCADTPQDVKVDKIGCPLDADSDGVPDYLDKCSDTPANAKVDPKGCPLDLDKDGVPDYLDKCPNTPAGTKVDQNGCPLDSDGDGVPDNLDKCPNTQKGVEVNSEGCATEKEIVIIEKPAEIESLVLSGDTNFEFNKSKLLPNAYTVLNNLVGTMKEHPKYKWEIGGYTDGIGSVNYNIRLSERRAQSVVDYLVSQGVNRNSLKVVGYGKDNPIATNDTDEGRSMNRRVEIKLLSKE
ncbi:MAG: OmpA family protein [bacterium]